MTAGRLKYLRAGEDGPKTPAFRLEFEGGGAARSHRGGREEARRRLAPHPRGTPRRSSPHLGPEALGLGAERLAEILRDRIAPAALASPRPAAIAGIGRAWANEILHAAQLSPFALSTQLIWTRRRSTGWPQAIDSELARGLELRERGANDKKTYRVHNQLGEPCHVCGTPIARVDFEEHTIYYCPTCQTGGRTLKDRRLSRLLR